MIYPVSLPIHVIAGPVVIDDHLADMIVALLLSVVGQQDAGAEHMQEDQTP